MTSQYARHRHEDRGCTLCGGEVYRSGTFNGVWMNLCALCYKDLDHRKVKE